MGWQTSDLCMHEKELAGGATEDRDRKGIDLSEKYKSYSLVAIRASEEMQWENEFGSAG